MTREEKIWRRIDEITDRNLRLAAVKDAFATEAHRLLTLRTEREQLLVELEGLRGHPGLEPGAPRKVYRLKRDGLVLLALDLPIQFVINRAAVGTEIGSAWIAAGSVGLALGIGWAVRRVAASRLDDKARPGRGIRIAELLGDAALIVAGAGLTVWILSRVLFEGAGWLVQIAWYSLAVMGETLPASAGFFGAAAQLLEKPLAIRKRLEDVEKEIAASERLIERLKQEEERLCKGQ